MNKIDLFWLLSSIGICEGVGVAGGLCTSQAVPGWYSTLHKPSFNPPSWVFGPVWTTLYALMGIAMFLVYQKKNHSKVPVAIFMFSIQLALNLLWSIIFFCMKSPFGAFIEIVLLWIAIAATTILFWNLSKKAAMLLIPYLLWVSFASVLNFEFWKMNR